MYILYDYIISFICIYVMEKASTRLAKNVVQDVELSRHRELQVAKRR